jgi:Kef-type K+ transport system membrane component KefB
MEQTFNFTPLLVVTVLAVLVPVALQKTSKLGIPIVVGEILAGIAVGSAGFGLVTEIDPWLEFLKQFGFAYLMFLSGLEIDFDLFFRRDVSDKPNFYMSFISSPFYSGILFSLVTVVLSIFAATWLVQFGLAGDVVIMGLIFATTSLGVVMPVLKERGLSYSDLGQHILVASGLGDFVTVAFDRL